MKKLSSVALVAVMVMLAYSCVNRATIGGIRKDPGWYSGKDVLIEGTVKKLIQVPLTPAKVYELEDNTGSLYVVSVKPAEYSIGKSIDFKGRVFYLGGESLTEPMDPAEKFLTEQLISQSKTKPEIVKIAVKAIFDMVKALVKDKTVVLLLIEYA